MSAFLRSILFIMLGISSAVAATPVATLAAEAAVPAAVDSTQPAATNAEKSRRSARDYLNFRDPFLKPSEEELFETDKPPLQIYGVSEFKLRGVLSGPLRKRAMVEAPDGKTYLVAERMIMGTRNGKVRRITTRSIIIEEQVLNPVGEPEQVETELVLESK